jgi:carboxyl-terminal processing protease
MKHLIFNLIFCGFFAVSLAQTTQNQIKPQGKQKADITLYHQIKEASSQLYVDDFNEEEFVYNSLNGGLNGMDPHSNYLKPQDYNKFKDSMTGEFGGLGIQIVSDSGFVKVVAPIDDTPAFKAGVKAGDYITHINDENTYQMSIEEASSKMRGKEGTRVKITIIREGLKEPIHLDLKREKIKNKSVSVKDFDGIAIVRLSSFIQTTASEMKEEILKRKPNIKGIIIDLRNNPGGVLEQAIAIPNFFLKDGLKIVSVKSKIKLPSEDKKIAIACVNEKKTCEEAVLKQTETEGTYYSTASTIVGEEIPIVVIINGGSASASEIVAGALKDNKRGVIIGELSFGKGVVQSILPINNGENGALKITVSRYYSPSGASIQTAGITPNITVLNAKAEVRESKFQGLFSQREGDLKNHTVGEKLEEIARQSEKYAKSKEDIKAYYEDLQMLTAISIIKAFNVMN